MCRAQAGGGPISSIPPWRRTRNFTKEHVHWPEQGRNAVNFQQAGFERAAQEHEQAACDEVHVTVAQATEMFRAEFRTRMGALGNQSEQTWTSHPVVLQIEMNSVAGDAHWKTREQVCSVKQRQTFKGINGKVMNTCKKISRVFNATCLKFNKKSKSIRLRVDK